MRERVEAPAREDGMSVNEQARIGAPIRRVIETRPAL